MLQCLVEYQVSCYFKTSGCDPLEVLRWSVYLCLAQESVAVFQETNQPSVTVCLLCFYLCQGVKFHVCQQRIEESRSVNDLTVSIAVLSSLFWIQYCGKVKRLHVKRCCLKGQSQRELVPESVVLFSSIGPFSICELFIFVFSLQANCYSSGWPFSLVISRCSRLLLSEKKKLW